MASPGRGGPALRPIRRRAAAWPRRAGPATGSAARRREIGQSEPVLAGRDDLAARCDCRRSTGGSSPSCDLYPEGSGCARAVGVWWLIDWCCALAGGLVFDPALEEDLAGPGLPIVGGD